MRLIFNCEDEICLPIVYDLIDDIKPLVEIFKNKKVSEKQAEKANPKSVLKMMLKSAMVESPKETSKVLAKFWVLDEGEKAPNVFKTIPALLNSEEALGFFVSALPSLVQLLNVVSPQLKLEK